MQKPRITLIGSPKAGKSTMLSLLARVNHKINPPEAQALYKCGYITEESRKKLTNEWHAQHGTFPPKQK